VNEAENEIERIKKVSKANEEKRNAVNDIIDNSGFAQAVKGTPQISNPILSIVVMFDEANAKKWLNSFIQNLPRLSEKNAGLIEVVLCSNVKSESYEARHLKTQTISNVIFKDVENHYIDFRFDEARNAAKIFAEGEWILSLDTDEYIEQRQLQTIFDIIDNTQKSVGGVKCTMFSHLQNKDGSYTREAQPSVRLFRNDKNILWTSQVHECLDYSILIDNGYTLIDSTITINHIGYEVSTDILPKLQRNFDRLCAEVANPTNLWTKAHATDYIVRTLRHIESLI
jgi:hypothetical protein